MVLTTPQKRAIALLLDRGFLLVDSVPVRQWADESGKWTTEYKRFDKSCFVNRGENTYTPSPKKEGYNDSKTSWLTISFTVAGELQNKDLAKVSIVIKNHWIVLELTPFGKQVAASIEGH